MLHPLDDFPVHQTSEPLLHVATSSPNAYDRFFFNGFSADGEVFFAVALGVYPQRQVMDGALSVIHDGVQHNVRASGPAPADRTRTAVDPLTVEVIEPMRRHRIVVDDRFGIRAELDWTSISPAIEEPRFTRVVEGRTQLDYTRLTQFGRWEGGIEIDGTTIEIGDGVVGVRDRSWGVRPVGPRITGPSSSAPQFYWLWAPTVFDDVCTHLALNHDAEGLPWHQSGAVAARIGPDDEPLDPARVQRATAASAEPVWGPGTRWAEAVTTNLERWRDEPVKVEYEPLLRFQMSGIGYGHPEWGHGMWRGGPDAIRDAIDLAAVDPEDPTMIHIQALSRARWGERTGVGVVEQLVFGPHQPTGLMGLFAGAAG